MITNVCADVPLSNTAWRWEFHFHTSATSGITVALFFRWNARVANLSRAADWMLVTRGSLSLAGVVFTLHVHGLTNGRSSLLMSSRHKHKHQNKMFNGRGPVYGNFHSACKWSLLKVTLEKWSSYVPYGHSMSYVLWYNKGLCELTCVCICQSFVNFNYRCLLCIFTLFAEQVFCMYLYLLEYCYRGNLNYFFFMKHCFTTSGWPHIFPEEIAVKTEQRILDYCSCCFSTKI